MEQKNMLPGLTREAEEQKLQEIIGIAQQNLERARADIRKVNEDLEDLLDVYEAQDKEGLALWNNATARLKENEYDLVRYEKARRKPYFGRIDFKDPNVKGDESYYIGRVGIAKNNSEPVVLDWRAPIASVYYESGLGPCQYTVSSEGTFTIDLKRKRTYEIENDHLKDFFDSDVVANAGRISANGSYRSSIPLSIRIIAATAVTGFVMEYNRKIVFRSIGFSASRSAIPACA